MKEAISTKNLVSLMLALVLALTALAVPAMAEEPLRVKNGVLTMLNLNEEDMSKVLKAQFIQARQLGREGYNNGELGKLIGERFDDAEWPEIVYYDTLDAMLMALNAGEIGNMVLYDSTANYLLNAELVKIWDFLYPEEDTAFIEMTFHGLLATDFAFMLQEDSAALRDEFNAAMAEMKADGTLEKLIADHITAASPDADIAPVELPVIDGAETIRVAVTGALPPMDYVAPNGAPAGFSTAVLAEIARRLNKNVEIVVVSSVGRAMALASGSVDVVFWTRTSSYSNELALLSEAERQKRLEDRVAQLADDEKTVSQKVSDLVDFISIGADDMPEGTIITGPYYTDHVMCVTTRARVDALKAQFGNQ